MQNEFQLKVLPWPWGATRSKPGNRPHSPSVLSDADDIFPDTSQIRRLSKLTAKNLQNMNQNQPKAKCSKTKANDSYSQRKEKLNQDDEIKTITESFRPTSPSGLSEGADDLFPETHVPTSSTSATPIPLPTTNGQNIVNKPPTTLTTGLRFGVLEDIEKRRKNEARGDGTKHSKRNDYVKSPHHNSDDCCSNISGHSSCTSPSSLTSDIGWLSGSEEASGETHVSEMDTMRSGGRNMDMMDTWPNNG